MHCSRMRTDCSLAILGGGGRPGPERGVPGPGGVPHPRGVYPIPGVYLVLGGVPGPMGAAGY